MHLNKEKLLERDRGESLIMTDEKLNEWLIDHFSTAFQYGQFYYYLAGKGDYRLIFKDSVSYDRNDIFLMAHGINLYVEKYNCEVNDFIENSLISMLNSNNVYRVYTALDFVREVVRHKDEYKFKLNIENIFPLLNTKLNEHKNEMKNINVGEFNIPGGMWGCVERMAYFLNLKLDK